MSKRYTAKSALFEMFMILTTLFLAFPLYIAVSSAFKTEEQVYASPLGLPVPVHFGNFREAWVGANMGQAFLSTTIITVGSVFGLVAFGSLAAYVIARRTERWSTVAYYGFLVGLLLPPLLTMIPLYAMIRDAGLLGTYWSLIIVYIGGQMPFTIFLFAGFMRTLPIMYEEAAMVDGASTWSIYTKIVLPLIKPIVGTVIILNSVFIWNDFLNPLLYLAGSGKQTLAVSIYSFVGVYSTQWALIFAGVVMAALPMIGVFFLLQRSFLRSFEAVLKG